MFLAPGDLDVRQRELYDSIVGGRRSATRFPPVRDDGSLRTPFNLLLYSPRLGDAVQSLGAAIRFGGSLDAYTREACICLVAALARCRHQWTVHSVLAGDAGVDDGLLASLLADEIGESWPEPTRSTLHLARALVRVPRPDDAELERARERVSESTAVEVAILVGYYELLAGLHRLAGDPPLDLTPEG